MASNKQIAIAFLELITQGNIDEAYEQCTDPEGKHHDVNFPAGLSALNDAMKENHKQFPNKETTIKHVIAEEDMVAVHTHVKFQANDPGFIIIHIWRFENNKIVEMWDSATKIPDDLPNRDGPF